jgi:hypothetical protein
MPEGYVFLIADTFLTGTWQGSAFALRGEAHCPVHMDRAKQKKIESKSIETRNLSRKAKSNH